MNISALLCEHLRGLCLEENFSFARHTTIGCGGSASVCAYPQDREELFCLLKILKNHGIPYCFLGAGANVLPADCPFEGVVIRFMRFSSIEQDGEEVLCGAGVTAGELLRFTEERGLGGLEFLTGIPASMGGAVVMNAGVKERHLSDIVQTVYAVEGGKARSFPRNECDFSEKRSIFQSGIAVTHLRLKAAHTPREEILERKAYFRAKRAHLPKGRSMGCVFVNPAGASAGEIIDRCGLKGLSRGGAFVSREHANFIINRGGTSEDIQTLIRLIKVRVFSKTGIRLREEIRYIP